MITIELPPMECALVNNVTTDSIEQCKFVIDNGCLEKESVIDYVYLVYCDMGYELRYLSIILIALLIIVLFLALGSIADEFLCPSLLAVAKSLRMSDSLAGITLLAFGNGCPDIFSSLAAASDERTEMIVSELLGAGIFCTSIVSGLIFIQSDFKIARRPTLRDTMFYLLAVYLIWVYCSNQQITFYGALAFILIYVIYLAVALIGQAIHSRLKGNYPIVGGPSMENPEISEDEKNTRESWYHSREDSIKRRQVLRNEKRSDTLRILQTSSPTSQDSQKSQASVDFTVDNQTLHIPTDLIDSSKIQTIKQISSGTHNKAFISDEDLQLDEIVSKTTKSSSPTLDQQQNISPMPLCEVAKNTHQQSIKFPTNYSTMSPNLTVSNRLTWREFDEFLYHINPINLDEWYGGKNYFKRTINVIQAPFILLFIITIPIVDNDKKMSNWCRLLNSIHCISMPLSIIVSKKFDSFDKIMIFKLSLSIWLLIFACILGVLVLMNSEAQKPPKYHNIFAYFGFLMSVVWIYTLATEIISALKTVGIMFGMSDAAIGLAFLAWGNSLGDIVANVTLARAGYPRMAIGASVGAPLLNVLLGFGLAFTLYLKPGESVAIAYTPTITLLCSTLSIILILLMLSTLAPSDKSKKPFGYVLIAVYLIYFLLAICLEYKLINFS